MISVNLPPKAEKLLAEMAEATGMTAEQIVFDAIIEAIGDWHDGRIVEERLRNWDGVGIPLEEVIHKFEARDSVRRRRKSPTE